MGRNGALSVEEWRPRWPPLWVHSTNLFDGTTPKYGVSAVI
jgi:hypothetical protein